MRTTAIIAEKLNGKKARQAELTDRRALASADLQAKRTARARCLAEGSTKKAPTAAEIAALAEECDGITAALALLAEDVTTLEAEAQSVGIAEAEEAQRVAIEHAMTAMAALDTTLHEVVSASILPAFDSYRTALRTARDADNDLDRLRQKASTKPLPVLPGKSDRVTNRRGALLSLLTSIIAYTKPGGAS